MPHRFSHITTTLLCLIGFFGLLGVLFLHPLSAQSNSTHTAFLPFVVAGPAKPSVFGMQTGRLASEGNLQGLIALELSWVRRGALLWKNIEPVEGGDYRWDSPQTQAMEQEMITASQHNINLILVVLASPHWATEPYQATCAPINPDKYRAFADFMAAAVQRYSKPPYNVKYWEIGNEPDAYIFPSDPGYGCWGLVKDPFYGGHQYGEMLKVVYPAIKAADPQAQVLNGGLLLDQPYDPVKNTGLSARFIEGIFRADAADSFDILSYHSYSYYNGTADGTLGDVDWKIGYLRDVMAAYNVQKPLFNTEGALLCPTVSDACRQAQADFVGRAYTRALTEDIMGFIWYVYDNDSFRNTALIEPGNPSSKRPAYQAYQQVAAMLRGATYQEKLANLPIPAEGYRFARGNELVTVFWSDVDQDVVIPAPASSTVQCFDWDGTELPCSAVRNSVILTASSGPKYVVVKP
ncbi:MAG: hypothetical protein MI924_36790 [Chloroflexales bacterium]|nr:hypothetical protein [Chloroflexales bacterium]